MWIVNFLLDAIILTLNVVIVVACVSAPVGAYQQLRTSYAVWDDRAPWLPRFMAAIGAGFVAVLMIAIVWAGWAVLGFPTWGRWLFG